MEKRGKRNIEFESQLNTGDLTIYPFRLQLSKLKSSRKLLRNPTTLVVGGIHFKKSQISVFIILSILIVAGIGIYFAFRSNAFFENIPKEFEPVYEQYLSCIDDETLNGAIILENQGGYIEAPEFSPASSYMPFSSQLNFLGGGIPYWYYISSNSIAKEQVPSKELMQSQLDNLVKKRINDCDFSRFEIQGFVISRGEVKKAESFIKDNLIKVKINQDFTIKKGDSSWTSNEHVREVRSKLGTLYELALKIYGFNKETMFLENYGVDILRVYAPVDGVEISCSPKIWLVKDIRERLNDALEANTAAIKIRGDYYKIKNKENIYFVQDIGEKIDANVNFLFQRNWPMKMEVWPSEDNILKAEPVGLQQGMEILGFCYITYHFVYDLAYPVLIQVSYGEEIFQFPVVVFVNKNKPREALDVESVPNPVPELCEHKNTKIKVLTFNTKLEPIPAYISFKCLGTNCDIGKTSLVNKEAILNSNFPQCINGFIVASAEGYKTKKVLASTLNENSFQIVLDKNYKMELEVKNLGSGDYAIIDFTKNNESMVFSYPGQKEIQLTEGQYEIKAYAYGNSGIRLQPNSIEKCVSVPKSGMFGILGAEEKKCFKMDIPEQEIGNVILGGGKAKYYIAESELENSKKIIIDIENFEAPEGIEELKENYNKIESSIVDVRFE